MTRLHDSLSSASLYSLTQLADSFSDLDADSRATFLDILLSCVSHSLHYRCILLLIVSLYSRHAGKLIPPEVCVKSLKSITKDLLQVKYSNLWSKAENKSVGYGSKLFKISMQL